MVLRPDSGDPVECILAALRAGEANFTTTKNKKVRGEINNTACAACERTSTHVASIGEADSRLFLCSIVSLAFFLFIFFFFLLSLSLSLIFY